MIEFLKEYLEFLKERKKWILIPVFLFVILLTTLIFMAQGSAVSPFVYTLF